VDKDDHIFQTVCRIEEKLDRHIEKNHVTQGQLIGYLSVLGAIFASALTIL